jgi:hypothetical protein
MQSKYAQKVARRHIYQSGNKPVTWEARLCACEARYDHPIHETVMGGHTFRRNTALEARVYLP